MSAYMVSQIRVHDRQLFQTYLEKSKAIAGPLGAELVVSAQHDSVLNGDVADHQLLVIARFPSKEAIETWFNSEAYNEIVPLREQASHQIMSIYTDLPAG